MGPLALAQVLRPLAGLFPAAEYPDLLVGLDGPDDAAAYRLSDDEAIIATTDFFAPVVDDPADFGAIAAVNAMSDVFAMGGEVLLALNLLAFPDDLDPGIAAEILQGGAEMVRQAGGVVAGGHTVVDPEPKFGLAVLGRVHPAKILRKAGARVGDVLVLTKPLGTGLVTTALKRDLVRPAELEAAVASMRALNRAAGRAAVAAGAHAATDITGFSLLGHGLEMAEPSGVALEIRVADLPILPGALRLAALDCVPGGTGRNRDAYAPRVRDVDTLSRAWQGLLFDPQTSGGLLVALAADGAAAYVAAVAAEGVDARIIGAVVTGEGIVLTDLPHSAQV